MTPDELESRCRNLAKDAFVLCAELRSKAGGSQVADQLQRSSGSAASNYGAARRARSRAEFIAKLGLTLEEANETVGWLQHVEAIGLASGHRLARLLDEATQLRAILAASCKTARARRRRDQQRAEHRITK